MIPAKIKRNMWHLKKYSGGSPSFVGDFSVVWLHASLLWYDTDLGTMTSYTSFNYYLNLSFLQP